MIDEKYMLYCFDLAKRSRGKNMPNPMVGAVIVHDNNMIGEGYHQQYGNPHAEINAIHSVKPEDKVLLAKSVLYVSLEPCSHHGKTPPCADAIIRAGIPEVVVGTKDPNPVVAGNGIKKLQDSGVTVHMSQHHGLANLLLKPFKAHLQKRPYIILKLAKSKDHFIGKKDQKIWLSNEKMKVISHIWRSETDAILIGKNTALTDNPELTTRLVDGQNPVRIVIDKNLECPEGLNIFKRDSQVFHINGSVDKTVKNITFKSFRFDHGWLKELFEYLFSQNIYTVMVEGGAFTLTECIKSDLWDEAKIICTPVMLTEGIKAPDITGYQYTGTLEIGDNSLLTVFREKV